MSANALNKQPETDWERVDALSDKDIDTFDIPPLDEAFFANAKVRLPQRKVPITIRLDKEKPIESPKGSSQMLLNLQHYHRPTDIDQAVALLRRGAPGTVVLAGGTTLLASQRRDVEAVVDLRDLPLAYARVQGATLHIGATTTLQNLADAPDLQAFSSGVLAEMAGAVANRNIRNAATLGGCVASAGGENPLLAALLALDAEVVVHTSALADDGPRQIPLAGFLNYRQRLLAEGALIGELRLPLLIGPLGAAVAHCSYSGSRLLNSGKNLRHAAYGVAQHPGGERVCGGHVPRQKVAHRRYFAPRSQADGKADGAFDVALAVQQQSFCQFQAAPDVGGVFHGQASDHVCPAGAGGEGQAHCMLDSTFSVPRRRRGRGLIICKPWRCSTCAPQAQGARDWLQSDGLACALDMIGCLDRRDDILRHLGLGNPS